MRINELARPLMFPHRRFVVSQNWTPNAVRVFDGDRVFWAVEVDNVKDEEESGAEAGRDEEDS